MPLIEMIDFDSMGGSYVKDHWANMSILIIVILPESGIVGPYVGSGLNHWKWTLL